MEVNGSFLANKTVKNVFVGLVGVFLGLSIILLAVIITNQFKAGQAFDNVITVEGTGKAIGIPDIAEVYLSVVAENKDSDTAQSEVSKKMEDIIANLKSKDIDKEDIKTTEYTIYPNYDYRSSTQKITGYTARQTVSVKIRETDKTGEILASATSLGANQIGGVNFTVEDPEELKSEARKDAFAEARRKAEEMADAAGVHLGRVVNINENFYPSPIFYDERMATGYGGASDSVTPPVEVGSQEISVTVNMTFQIR